MTNLVAEGGSAAHCKRLLLLVMVFARLLGLAVLTVDLSVGWSHNEFTWPVALLGGAVIAESAAMLAASWRRGSVSRGWAAADAIFIALGLLAFASQSSKSFDPWSFMFQFSLTTTVTIGVSFRRLRSVLLWQCVPAGAYAATALFERNYGWNVPQDLVTFFGLAVVIWALAREFQRWGQTLDKARAEAVARESALAAERERMTGLRDMHDRVLQTLETLARGRFINDKRILAQVTKDAFWLRRLVAGHVAAAAGDMDFSTALATVIQDQVAAGLRVRLHTSRVREQPAEQAAHALAAAVGEALTNVRKHSGVDQAVVQAASEDGGITVSVLDSGRGFDLTAAGNGIGLRDSIGRRLEQVGGRVRIDTAAGSGTCVEMWVPVKASARGAA